MDLKFDKNTGRILSCIVSGKLPPSEEVLSLAEEELPEDFMATFPLGKYLVKNGEIVENKKIARAKTKSAA